MVAVVAVAGLADPEERGLRLGVPGKGMVKFVPGIRNLALLGVACEAVVAVSGLNKLSWSALVSVFDEEEE
jgi:hypothetical protein